MFARTRLVFLFTLVSVFALSPALSTRVDAINLIPSSYYKNKLFHASKNGDEQAVQKLLLKLPDHKKAKVVNSRHEPLAKKTALIVAVQEGYTEIVRILLNAGANVNQSMRLGYTPLYIAAGEGHTDIVKILLNQGASVNARDTLYNQTALHNAASSGHGDIVKLLVQNGASMSKKDKFGFTSSAYCERSGILLDSDLTSSLDSD